MTKALACRLALELLKGVKARALLAELGAHLGKLDAEFQQGHPITRISGVHQG